MARMLRKNLIICFVWLALSACPGLSINVRAETNAFPLYPCIEINVSFWKSIYAHYSNNQGVIHDKKNLNIIYGVIELEDPDLPGGRKINRERIKKAKKKYKTILKKLTHNPIPFGPEEQQVADLFGPEARRADYKKAIKNLRCQVGQKDRFREGVIRSGAYLEEIRRIFRNYGLPEDLAYLPHVESSFNPKAYSKFGAAGIWQFTRSTGKRYMKVGYTVDERRDPVLSSQAAAKLLKKNYDKFLNWPMTITAYNYGTNGMLRAQRAKGSYEAIFKDYKKGLFKFASRNFYSEFLAAREVAKNYRQYFGELQLDVPWESIEVTLDGYASLPKLARYLEVDLQILRKINPALRNPVFSGQKLVPKGYRLRLPDIQDRDWVSLIAELAPEIFRHYQKHSRFYTVRKGDTASEIAKIHGINLKDLIAANNLDARATIYVNQNLRIPLPGEETPKAAAPRLPDVADKQKSDTQTLVSMVKNSSIEANDGLLDVNWQPADRQQVITSPQLRQRKKKPESGSAPLLAKLESIPEQNNEMAAPSQHEPAKEIYRRDTASNPESLKSHVTEKQFVAESQKNRPGGQLAALNPSPDLASQKSKIIEQQAPAVSSHLQTRDIKGPQKASAVKDSWIAGYQPHETAINPLIIIGNLAVERVRHQSGMPVGIIRVEVEETLGHYAEWLKVTTNEIRQLNGLRYGRMIRIDQPLKIPLHRVTKEEFEENRFEYHKELAEDFFATYRVESVQTYSVKKGDNIWTLAREEFEVPMWLFRRYNIDADFYTLMPSQKLLVPIVEKII
ncbi:MAG: transglycosylase SLT domain-containing protein [Deltaproteobacteria bacterium]|nr:MAG: transglycosylase SLT domain-containing protein [Deltaproteobacteria bacterium]